MDIERVSHPDKVRESGNRARGRGVELGGGGAHVVVRLHITTDPWLMPPPSPQPLLLCHGRKARDK